MIPCVRLIQQKLTTAPYMFFARRAAGGTGEENHQHDQVRGYSADS